MSDNVDAVSHAAIIIRNGGSAKVSRAVGVSVERVKGWKRNDSIPGAYWRDLVDAGLASFRELSDAAALR